jgi:hypothetical protein
LNEQIEENTFFNFIEKNKMKHFETQISFSVTKQMKKNKKDKPQNLKLPFVLD